ncbi:MAG: hypothetical protein AAF108_00990 [Planctomycetota bacterium]
MPARWIPICLCSVVVVLFAWAGFGQEPAEPVTRPNRLLRLDAAIETSNEQLVVALVRSDSCAACDRLKDGVWSDPRPPSDAVVFEVVDVTDAASDRLRTFGIDRLPAILAVRDGRVVDRVFSETIAADLPRWIAGWREGRVRADLLREDLEATGVEGQELLRRRRAIADALVRAGRDDDAFDEYLWVFENTRRVDTDFLPMRNTFVVSDLRDLCARSERGRALAESRAEKLDALIGTASETEDVLTDWLIYNEIAGRAGPVLEWVDRNIESQDGQAKLKQYRGRLEDVLVEAGRFEELGVLFAPFDEFLVQLERLYDNYDRMIAADPELAKAQTALIDGIRAGVRDQVTIYVSDALTANRSFVVGKLVRLALERDASPEMERALLSAAVKAKRTCRLINEVADRSDDRPLADAVLRLDPIDE